MRGTDEKCHAFFREFSWEWFLWLDWAPRELLSRQIAEEKRGESTERVRVTADCGRKSWRINRESACHGRLRKKIVENQPRELLSRLILREMRGESTERARVMVDFSKKSEIFTESTCFAINYIENIEKND